MMVFKTLYNVESLYTMNACLIDAAIEEVLNKDCRHIDLNRRGRGPPS